MRMADGKFAADGYKIIQSAETDGLEIAMAGTLSKFLKWSRKRHLPEAALQHAFMHLFRALH
jgi:hypothetical protein